MAAAGGGGAAHAADDARAARGPDPRASMIGSNAKRLICEFVGPSMALAMRHFDAPIRPVVADAAAEGAAAAPERLDVFIDVRHRLSALLLIDSGLAPRIWHAEGLLRVIRGRALRGIDITRARLILRRSSREHGDQHLARIAVSDFMRLLGELQGKVHLLTPASRALLELILLIQQHKETLDCVGFEAIPLLTSEPAFTHVWDALGLPAGDSSEAVGVGGLYDGDDLPTITIRTSTLFYNDESNRRRLYHAVLLVPLLRAKFMPLTAGLSCPVEDLAAELAPCGSSYELCRDVLLAKHLQQKTPLVQLLDLGKKCGSLFSLFRTPFWDTADDYPLSGVEEATEVLRRRHKFYTAVRMREEPLLRWVARMHPAAFAYLPVRQRMTLIDIADYVPMFLKETAKTRCLTVRHALTVSRPATAEDIRETIVEDDAARHYTRSEADPVGEPIYNDWNDAGVLWLREQWGPGQMTHLQAVYLLKLAFRDNDEFPFDWDQFAQQLHEDAIEPVFLEWTQGLVCLRFDGKRAAMAVSLARDRLLTAAFLDALADHRRDDITEGIREEATKHRRILPVKETTKKIVFVKVSRPRKSSSSAAEDDASDNDDGAAAGGGGGARANAGDDIEDFRADMAAIGLSRAQADALFARIADHEARKRANNTNTD